MAKKTPPDWSYRSVIANEREATLKAHQAGKILTNQFISASINS